MPLLRAVAPTCRVCVSCKLPIDPARILGQRPAALEAAVVSAPPEEPPVRFSWKVFFAVLGIAWVLFATVTLTAGISWAYLMINALQPVAAVWVFWDARRKLIRKPLRWALGCIILWVVMLPWYLVRRQKLNAPSPFVESESGPFIKVMLLLIFIFFMISLIASKLGIRDLTSLENQDGKTVVLPPKKN